MADVPEARESNAIRRPSAHQLGAPVCGPLNEVNLTGLWPSASASQISELPERVDSKAMRVPSGEYAGTNCVRVDAIRLLLALDGALRSARQISMTRLSRTKAMPRPETVTPGPRDPSECSRR